MANGVPNMGINPFALLNLLGQYHELVKVETDNLPELEQIYGELSAWVAKHKTLWAVLPELQQAITEIQAIAKNHDKLIKLEGQYVLQMQAFARDLLALVAPQQ